MKTLQGDLTIVVPVRNRAELVGRTLDSIASGRMLPSRLLVVDNGSTDGTLALCRSWAKSHPEIIADVIEEPRRGASCARNRGLREVQTEWVYFFDSDDDMDADFVADVTMSLKADSRDLVFIPVNQEYKGHCATRQFIVDGGVTEQVLSSMLSTVTCIFRTSWLLDIGGWDERLTTWDDWELGIRALTHSPRITWLTQRAYHLVHVHEASQTGGSFTQTLDATLTAMRCAAEDIAAAPFTGQQRKRPMHALYLRAHIMAGQLLREGNADGGDEYKKLASQLLPEASLMMRMTGSVLRRYVARGCRGAWRIALRMSHLR